MYARLNGVNWWNDANNRSMYFCILFSSEYPSDKRIYRNRLPFIPKQRYKRQRKWYLSGVLRMVRSLLREGNSTPLQYSCLEITRTEEPGRLQSMGSKSWTRLSNFTFTVHFHALEKEMATHLSGRARRIPGTAEPGGLPSMGSHRVRQDWSDLAAAAAVNYKEDWEIYKCRKQSK